MGNGKSDLEKFTFLKISKHAKIQQKRLSSCTVKPESDCPIFQLFGLFVQPTNHFNYRGISAHPQDLLLKEVYYLSTYLHNPKDKKRPSTTDSNRNILCFYHYPASHGVFTTTAVWCGYSSYLQRAFSRELSQTNLFLHKLFGFPPEHMLY